VISVNFVAIKFRLQLTHFFGIPVTHERFYHSLHAFPSTIDCSGVPQTINITLLGSGFVQIPAGCAPFTSNMEFPPTTSYSTIPARLVSFFSPANSWPNYVNLSTISSTLTLMLRKRSWYWLNLG